MNDEQAAEAYALKVLPWNRTRTYLSKAEIIELYKSAVSAERERVESIVREVCWFQGVYEGSRDELLKRIGK